MSKNIEVMVIDDDPEIQSLLRKLFTLENYAVVLFDNALDALEELAARKRNGTRLCDLIVCDLKMPDLDGLAFIERAKALEVTTPIIQITAHGSVETAVEALKKGAFDYVVKPINLIEMNVISRRAIEMRELEDDRESLRAQLDQTRSMGKMIGKSPKIKQTFDLVERVARSASNVLVTGESGTGKEMVARAIHSQSPRSAQAFIAINCSAIPDHLLESELFGHKKGSFTGAQEARRGLFEEANGGTIFLDEIGDMPLDLQAKLLRVIQEREIKPVGENKSRPIDVRIIAATHKDLRVQVAEEKFREDLYYRLCVIPIQLPALRERREDIPLLAEFFLRKYCVLNKTGEKTFSKAAMARLIDQPWAGNVRELENAVERAVVLSDHAIIEERDIQVEGVIPGRQSAEDIFGKLPTLEALEKDYIQYVLALPDMSKEKAAITLGINRKTLYRKEQDYGLQASGALAPTEDTATTSSSAH